MSKSTQANYAVNQDNPLWLQFWQDERVDFHQAEVNPLLARFWANLALEYGSGVFVPLCGKSLDMLWLVQQGHAVLGVELSPVAVAAFFRENHLQFTKQRCGQFTLWQSGRLGVLCGDYFALDKKHLIGFETVYDRSALTALPETIRRLYVAQLRKIMPNKACVFLLTIEDAAEHETLAQAIEVSVEIKALYQNDFTIELAYVESVFESDVTTENSPVKRAEYKVYRLLAESL